MMNKVCGLCFFCILCIQISYQQTERCLQEPKAGPCMARIPRLYYDLATNSCKEFFYGGCQGNDNNFETLQDCDGVCVTKKETQALGDRCSLLPETGDCKASHQRLYYDPDTNTCKVFTYGGCGGNKNNFETTEQCQMACVKNITSDGNHCLLKPETGVCKARIPRLFYDSESNTCQEFIYGGCGGNANNFRSVEECDQSCVSMTRSAANKCSMPKEVGPCKMQEPRVYYDSVESKCTEFTYGGCDGNENNFKSKEDCENACVQPDNICDLKSERGNCFGMIFRYYYNSTTKACGEFIYGGCGGNKNNFHNLEECELNCGNLAPATTVTNFYIVFACLLIVLARISL